MDSKVTQDTESTILLAEAYSPIYWKLVKMMNIIINQTKASFKLKIFQKQRQTV